MTLSCPACGTPSQSIMKDSTSLKMCENPDCRVDDFFSGDE